MHFINPKIDYAFKKIFGSEQSHDILISFLNALLYDGKDTIIDLEIIDPYLAPRLRGIKDTYVDVKATIQDEQGKSSNVIIEMQVLNVEGLQEEILYNAAKAKPIQIEDYPVSGSIIALTIADFIMFPALDHIKSHFIVKDKTYLFDYPIYDIELVFVELPKFQKSLEELETLSDKWLYFLKTARKLESVPPNMGNVPEINKAFAIANQVNLSKEELDDLDRAAIFISDQRNAIKKAERLGLEQGMKKGIEQGIEQGEIKTKLAIAQKLLNVLDDQAISESTGLSIEVIAKLRSS